MATITLKAYLAELEMLLEQERFEEVIAHCRHILQHYPKNVATYRILGRALLEKLRYEEAAQVFTRLLSADPGDFEAHVGLSEIHQRHNHLTQSIWHLERAFEQRPNQSLLVERLRELYRQKSGDAPEKIQLTRGALARQYINSQMYEQAIRELNQALDEQSTRPDLQLLLMETLWAAHYQREAGEIALSILRDLPDCLPANRLMAKLWLTAKRPQDAQSFLDKVEALAPYDSLETIYKTLNPDSAIPEGAFSLARYQWSAESAAAFADVETPEWFDSIGTAFTGAEAKPAPAAQAAKAAPAATPVPDWMTDSSAPIPNSDDLPDWFAAPGAGFSTSAAQKSTDNLPSPDDWFSELAVAREQAAPPPAPAPISASPVEALDWMGDSDTGMEELAPVRSSDLDWSAGSSMADDSFTSDMQTSDDDFLSSFLESSTSTPAASSQEDAVTPDWMFDSPGQSESTRASTGFTGLLSEWEASSSQPDDNIALPPEASMEMPDFDDIVQPAKPLSDTDELNELRAAARPPSADEVAALMAMSRTGELAQEDDDDEFDARIQDAELMPSWTSSESQPASATDALSYFDDMPGQSEVASDREEPDWMADFTPMQSQNPQDDDSFNLDDLGLPEPDFLETTPTDAADEFAMLFDEGNTQLDSATSPATTSDSDWMQDLMPQQSIEVEESASSDALDLDDLLMPEPDLLGDEISDAPADDFSSFMLNEASEEAAPTYADDAMSDWMGLAVPAEPEDIEATSAVGEFDFPELQGESQWLSAPSEMPDWEENVAELSGEAKAEHPDWLGPIGEELDWMAGSDEVETAAAKVEPSDDFATMFGEESSTAASMESTPDWLGSASDFELEPETADSDADDFSLMFGEEETPAAASIESTPDWLGGASDFELEPETADSGADDFSLMFGEEETPAAASIESTPDWLGSASDFEMEAETADSSADDFGLLFGEEETPAASMESTPDWMSGASDFELEPQTAESGADDFSSMFGEEDTPAASMESTPDWMSGASDFELEPETAESDADDFGLLFGEEETPTAASIESTPDWFGGASDFELEPETADSGADDFSSMFGEEETPAVSMESTPDWLGGASDFELEPETADSGADDFSSMFGEEDTPAASMESTPDWLGGASDFELEPETADSGADDFSSMFGEEDTPAASMESTPDWMSGASDFELEPQTADSGVDDFSLMFGEEETPAASMESTPDWMSGASDFELEPETADSGADDFSSMFGEEDTPAAASMESTPDWLSGASDFEMEAETSGGSADDYKLMFITDESAEPATESAPEWMGEVSKFDIQADDLLAEDLGELEFETSASDAMPSWLNAVEPQAEAAVSDAAEEWLTLDDILPAEPEPVTPAVTNLDNWLAAEEARAPVVDDDTADFALAEAEAEAQTELEDATDWLSGQELTVEVVSDHEVTDLEWLADLEIAGESAAESATQTSSLFGDAAADEQEADLGQWLSSQQDDFAGGEPSWLAQVSEETPSYASEAEIEDEETPAWLAGFSPAAEAEPASSASDVDELFSVITSGGQAQTVLKDAALTPEFDWMSAFSEEAPAPPAPPVAASEPESARSYTTEGTATIELPYADELAENVAEHEWEIEGEPPPDTIDLSDLFAAQLEAKAAAAVPEEEEQEDDDAFDFDALELALDDRLEASPARSSSLTLLPDLDSDSLASDADFIDTMFSDEDTASTDESRRTEFNFKKAPPWMKKLRQGRSGSERN